MQLKADFFRVIFNQQVREVASNNIILHNDYSIKKPNPEFLIPFLLRFLHRLSNFFRMEPLILFNNKKQDDEGKEKPPTVLHEFFHEEHVLPKIIELFHN